MAKVTLGLSNLQKRPRAIGRRDARFDQYTKEVKNPWQKRRPGSANNTMHGERNASVEQSTSKTKSQWQIRRPG